MISKEEVLKIASLARLELTEEEIEKMQKDLSEILDYFNLLKNAPKLEKVLADQNFNGRTLRQDAARQKEPDMADKLMSAAPDKKDGYIKVKNIL